MFHFLLSVVGVFLVWGCLAFAYALVKGSCQVMWEKLLKSDSDNAATDRFSKFERDGTNY